MDKDLKRQIEPPMKISQLSNDSLLIETLSKTQSEKVANIKSLNELAVTVEKHKSLNYVRGTLRSDTLTNSTEEEILEVLKNQGVIKVERMKTRRDGNLINTNRYILLLLLIRSVVPGRGRDGGLGGSEDFRRGFRGWPELVHGDIGGWERWGWYRGGFRWRWGQVR